MTCFCGFFLPMDCLGMAWCLWREPLQSCRTPQTSPHRSLLTGVYQWSLPCRTAKCTEREREREGGNKMSCAGPLTQSLFKVIQQLLLQWYLQQERVRVRVTIGFLAPGRVIMKIRIRIRVGVTFNVKVYHWSKCCRSKCRTFPFNPTHNRYSKIFSHLFSLKTLFNIVEAQFKELFTFDVCVVWWSSDGSINRQEYKSF